MIVKKFESEYDAAGVKSEIENFRKFLWVVTVLDSNLLDSNVQNIDNVNFL